MKRGVVFDGLNTINFNVIGLKNGVGDNIINNRLGVFSVLTLFFFILTFLLPITSATFALGTPNSSIQKIYGPAQDITGWLNISFTNEPLSSVFSSTIGSEVNTINLSEILKSNTGYNYSCSPLDCGNDYSGVGAASSKTFSLDEDNSSTYGVRLSGNIRSIESFGFNITSDATASCTNQIDIDIMDDGIIDFKNTNVLDSGSCAATKDYGCFDDSEPSELVDITPGTTTCERVNLSSSPGFILGAWIKKTGTAGSLVAAIYPEDGGSEISGTKCGLPDPSNPDGEEVSCSVNKFLEQGEYYVCVYPNTTTGSWATKGYTSDRCGFQGQPIIQETSAFRIFAQSKQFNDVGTILGINKSLVNGKSFAEMAEDYIYERYRSFDCSAGCVIPIRVTSHVDGQDVTLDGLHVRYTKEYSTTESNFYDIVTAPARITSVFKKLYLDSAGFSVPENLGNYTFSLKLNTSDVLSERIQVKDIPIIMSLNPTTTASAFPTEFVARISSSYNLSSFSWDFGDGTPRVTTLGNTGNKTTHTYGQTGTYTLTLSVTDSRRLSNTKTFEVNVTSPAELIELRLAELRAALTNIKTDISSLDSFSRAAINSSLGIFSMDSLINNFEARYNSATTEAQLNKIVADMLALQVIPESISKTGTAAGLPFVATADDINLDVLESIAGGNFSSRDEDYYAEAAAFWAVENLETKVDFNEFSGRYESGTQPIARTFKIKAREKRDVPYDYYLIMPQLSGFYSNSSFSNKSGHVYINLGNQPGGTVFFSTTEDVDLTDLPAFISPGISKLSITETLPEEIKTSKWLVFGLVLLALVVLGIIVYVILQEWYRRKYEKHLFPNRNDLYNLAVYINHAKKKGMNHSQIEENLKKTGWSGEKIRYAMRKYVGKRTGLPFEISFGKK